MTAPALDPGRNGAGPPEARWARWLGINSSTAALLGTILLVTAATELWSPLIPRYLHALRENAGAGDAMMILLIGAYGFYRDGLEAINYYAGGALSGWLNARRSLLLFSFLPLLGLGVLSVWPSGVGVFVAIPFIFVWDSIAGPATITVVGDSLPSDRRTMAFSLQAIFRRVSRVLAYCVSAPLVWYFGEINGVRLDAAIACGLVLAAVGIQFRYMRSTSQDQFVVMHHPRKLLRRFPAELKRLLAADILARWAEGMAGPFIILFCVPLLASEPAKGTALYQSVLLSIQAVTNVVLYIVVGPLASREGLAKKPYIGLTFLFFALFPLSLALLGPALGALGLGLAFVIGGLREIGEPARKAMIADLVPTEVRTQAIGLYWSVRSMAVMGAAPVGAVLWILGDRLCAGAGPLLTFAVAGLLGLVGAVMFFARFGRAGAGGSTGGTVANPANVGGS
ncbi:MAG: hypothetical protein HY763_03225 [Planctomycetes bacterium]|nr:hypothetical protein [Planctomycetota bacterium]